jgi:hypothetical protein
LNPPVVPELLSTIPNFESIDKILLSFEELIPMASAILELETGFGETCSK